MTPVTAMTAFLPFVEAQKRTPRIPRASNAVVDISVFRLAQ
jgi:hypothetical protein